MLGAHGVVVRYASRSTPRLPDIAASSFVVADASTGQVLAAKDPHSYHLPASTLKVLTAVTFIPLFSPASTVVASARATSVEPNVAGLVRGHSYPLSGLFTALLTISANDAAVSIAEAAGSYHRGIELMNAEARRLDARDTVAVDPNGLDAPGQHTSAYDLALVARQAVAMPAFMHYDQTRAAPFVVSGKQRETLVNQNKLLWQFRGGIGGKIGWTSAAGATYIGLARRNGVTLIATLMHCPAQTEITSAESLLDWGFSAEGKVRPVGALVNPQGPPLALAGGPAARNALGGRGSAANRGPSAGRRVGGYARAAGAYGAAGNGGRLAGVRSSAGAHHGQAGGPMIGALAFTVLAALAAGFGFAVVRRQRRGSSSD